MSSNRATYVIAGSAIGGAIAYFLLKARRRRSPGAVHRIDIKSVPQKMEALLETVERCAYDVSGRLENMRRRVMESLEAGRRGYDESEGGFRRKVHTFESKNDQIAAKVHRAIDELNRTILTLEKSILDPLYHLGSVVRGIRRGVRTLAG